jgi:hypothetical protein
VIPVRIRARNPPALVLDLLARVPVAHRVVGCGARRVTWRTPGNGLSHLRFEDVWTQDQRAVSDEVMAALETFAEGLDVVHPEDIASVAHTVRRSDSFAGMEAAGTTLQPARRRDYRSTLVLQLRPRRRPPIG